ncbi:MAG: CRTAC1 family protein [Pseudomonadales bacterium]|nr:CRTAC1 family protein [Pseudomonadales bacterium]MDP6473012.1 CRTAC1 family protein [Pseudomonadales bacterium]MDP6826231.1 CRTAC1 family protein [Pseudomonadales bacterium]
MSVSRWLGCTYMWLCCVSSASAEVRFTDCTELAGLRGQGATYGASWRDFNGDDLADLWVGNHNRAPNLYLNLGGGRFEDIIEQVWLADSTADTHGAAWADIDNDGFVDLFVSNGSDPTSPIVESGPHQLLCNDGNENRWLEIDLEGTRSNRDAYGAIVTLDMGGRHQTRVAGGGMHRFTQHHERLHSGLGNLKVVPKLTVRWPSGTEQTLENVASNQLLRIKEIHDPS